MIVNEGEELQLTMSRRVTTNTSTRLNEMEWFNQGGDAPDAPKLFLPSTQAGGLGINLVAANTVIFCDMDWDSQMVC